MKSKKLLLYCTKAKPYLYGMYSGFESIYGYHTTNDKNVFNAHNILNGKVVAECDFEVEEIIANDVKVYDEYGTKYTTKNGYQYIDNNFEALLNNSCLNAFELNDYLGGYGGYAIHIKNLCIFDKYRELKDFDQVNNCCFEKKVDKDWEGLPIFACIFTNGCRYQSDGYTCDKHYFPLTHLHNMSMVYDNINYGRKYIISLSPQELCRIANKEQTVLVRKNVLREML